MAQKANKFIECIPNVSEGQNPTVLKEFEARIRRSGAKLLDTYTGFSTHRTVFTFIGSAEEIEAASYAVIAFATEAIDMRKHRGSHPRLGAVDVCPFVPVTGYTKDDCSKLAERVALRAATELGVASYLYEHSARTPSRRLLADVRKGQYESIPSRIGKPEWAPDYGVLTEESKFGALTIGCRDFLVAYNINLDTSDLEVANTIAFHLRESGHKLRGIKGIFKGLSAIGWFLPETKKTQLSFNIRSVDQVPLLVLFRKAEELAKQFGTAVLTSELVGLVPERALRSPDLTTAQVWEALRFTPETPPLSYKLIEARI